MTEHLLSEQQAFDALRIASQYSYREPIDIAYEVVDTPTQHAARTTPQGPHDQATRSRH
jgi:hypothetical protein